LPEKGREFAGAGPERRSVSPILSVRVAAVARHAPALRWGFIPGPSARENAIESRFSVGARERHQLVKGCERERGWVRLCLGEREKRLLVKECERVERGAVLRLGGNSTSGSRLAC
jgi:hypothetical protein